MGELLFTVGKDRRKVAARDMTDNDLEFYAARGRSESLRDAAIAEQHRRRGGNGGAPRERQAPRQERRPPAELPRHLMGGLTDPAEITARLGELAENYNLISPASACATLPEGCEVMFSFITVDPSYDRDSSVGPDVYRQKGGKLSLKGDTLDRISNAAGVNWLLSQCHRVDDRRDPRLAEYVSTGAWQTFDGSWVVQSKPKCLDLREGSDQIDGMTPGNLLKKRQNINELAESGSRNRVIRKLGVKQSYDAAELAKPFAVVRLVFTGVTDNPQLQRDFALLKAQQMTGGVGALYGGQQHQAPALSGAAPPAQLPGRVTVEAKGAEQVEHDSDGVVPGSDDDASGYYGDDGGDDRGY